jgi:uncharacterized protein (TIGR03067 family)
MNHLLPLAVFAATLVAADNSGSDQPIAGKLVSEYDKERIQGTWAVTAEEVDGEEIKEGPRFEDRHDLKLTFKGDVVTNSKDSDQLKFTLDEGKRLLTFIYVFQLDNRQVKQKIVALYELKSDTLRLCLAGSLTGPGPKEFTSKNGQIVLTFKREPKTTEK